MLNVLHIESSSFFRNVIREIIEKKGRTYIGTSGPGDAFDILSEGHIGLIITSLEFKGISCIQLIDQLNNSQFSHIPIIVVTSTESIKMREQLFSRGVVDYILKKDLSYEKFDAYINSILTQDKLIQAMQKMDIAVLDDSRHSLNVIRHIFELNRINRVHYFQSPQKLLDSPTDYSIYLIDLVLPEMSGEDLILRIREKHENAVIISISGITNTKTISNVLVSGADDYVIKPFDANLFIARLKTNVRSLLLIRRMEKMAVTDGLTKAANHKYIFMKLREYISDSRKTGRVLSLILFDIDHFKNINDSYGHQAGDVVLVKVANTIRSYLPSAYCLGRYGGEEFLALLPGYDLEACYKKAEAIRKAVYSLKFSHKELYLSISGGCAEFKGESPVELVKQADERLYEAKRNGRNQIIKE